MLSKQKSQMYGHGRLMLIVKELDAAGYNYYGGGGGVQFYCEGKISEYHGTLNFDHLLRKKMQLATSIKMWLNLAIPSCCRRNSME